MAQRGLLAALAIVAGSQNGVDAISQYGSLQKGPKLFGEGGKGRPPQHPALAEHVRRRMEADSKLKLALKRREFEPANIESSYNARRAAAAPRSLPVPAGAASRPELAPAKEGLSKAEMVTELNRRLLAKHAGGKRRLQDDSESASPSVSAAATATRTQFPNLASPSSPPGNVTSADGPLEGVWMLQPNIPVQMYAEPGCSSIVAYLPSWTDEQVYNG